MVHVIRLIEHYTGNPMYRKSDGYNIGVYYLKEKKDGERIWKKHDLSPATVFSDITLEMAGMTGIIKGGLHNKPYDEADIREMLIAEHLIKSSPIFTPIKNYLKSENSSTLGVNL